MPQDAAPTLANQELGHQITPVTDDTDLVRVDPRIVDFDKQGLSDEEKSLAEVWVRFCYQGRPSSATIANACALAREKYGLAIQPADFRLLINRPDFRRYSRQIGHNARKRILRQLDHEAFAAAEDYIKTREMAMQQGDYKEARLAAADHLDRIGATRAKKESPTLTVQTVILRGKHFDATTLDAPTPTIEAAEIVEEEEDTQ